MMLAIPRRAIRPVAPRTIDAAIAGVLDEENDHEPELGEVDDRTRLPARVMAAIAASADLPPYMPKLREWAKGGVAMEHFDLWDEIDVALRTATKQQQVRLSALRQAISQTVEDIIFAEDED